MLLHTFHLFLFLTTIFVELSLQQTPLESLINFAHDMQYQNSNEPEDVETLYPEYDFIVVGAGTAGCAVANRLSENPDWKILLIEAGGPESFFMDIPAFAIYLQFTDANWKYKTVPNNKFCLGLDGKQCNWPRGKVMGGSSVLNYMIYTRGNRRDYDNWETMGNPGWSFKDVLPYFKRIEKFEISQYNDTVYHGQDGYVTINYAPYHSKTALAFIKAAKEAGFPYVDYNGPTQVGVSKLQANLRDGIRDSASRAYLHPISHRSNLHVKKLSMVSKVLIDPNTKQTYGVEFERSGKFYSVKASKEVILSAGAINSPQILMLSGIGPQKHLMKLGIPVLKHAKVGFNLMDHVAVGGLTILIDNPYMLTVNRATEPDNLSEYLNKHKGPLSVPGGCEVVLFSDLDHPNDPDGYPDMELLVQGGSLLSDPTIYKNFGITDELFKNVYKPIESKESFMAFPMLLRPKSTGRIILRSRDHRIQPMIFPNYFADEQDMKTIIKGTRLFLNITNQPAMKKLGARLHTIPIPGCEKFAIMSDNYIECMTRHFTFTIYHQSGTCKMGPKSDRSSVVDPRLRVHGIKGLRVIDASIIPVIPAAHTNAPTFMIAEKGADMIKKDWGMK